jgi:hypothetical protein
MADQMRESSSNLPVTMGLSQNVRIAVAARMAAPAKVAAHALRLEGGRPGSGRWPGILPRLFPGPPAVDDAFASSTVATWRFLMMAPSLVM